MKDYGYKKLVVWQKSMDLVVAIYKLTKDFPKEEVFGLTAQMRRATVSIPSNISEGSKRRGHKDSRQFYNIAFASGAELETQTEIARRLSYGKELNFKKVDELLSEVMKMLNKMVFGNTKD